MISYFELPKSSQAFIYEIKQSRVDLEDNLLVTLEDVNTDELEFFEVKKVDSYTRQNYSSRSPYQSRLSFLFSLDLNKTIIGIYKGFTD